MKKLFFYLVLFSSFAIARENPFAPAPGITLNDTAATNLSEEKKDFTQKSTQLPSNARILKYVIYGYQALDGSIQTKKVEIDENVDWHDPLVLTKESDWLEKTSQNYIPSISSSIDEQSEKAINKNVVKFKDFISFDANEKSLFVKTDDRNLRHFMVIKPYKIVLDFKRDTSFYTKKLDLNKPPFTWVDMGNHEGYYRAAIRLDGPYKYKVESKEDGVLITLE